MNNEDLKNQISQLQGENMRLKIKNRYLTEREENLVKLLIEAHVKIVQLEEKSNE